jgi:hypothetical protein
MPTTQPGGEIGAPPSGSGAVRLGQLGQYILLQEIGQGGMEKVFKARNVDRFAAAVHEFPRVSNTASPRMRTGPPAGGLREIAESVPAA